MRRIPLKIYNTETRQKEEVIPRDGHTIHMYTCGPTVYNFAHIGNFRTYVFEDLLRRVLLFFGYPVMQAMNLTDIDDKTIKAALENNISLDAFTSTYKKAFFDDLKTLNIQRVEYYPQATDYIAEMITLIQQLLDKGIAYFGADGSVYYAIKKFPTYGRLSHLHLKELKIGASGSISDEYEKENICDFALWKKYDPERDGAIFWESPFGPGRPGWHIECSAMAMKLLGQNIDIHVGGVDNMFPHHENEIAQSEGVSCSRFVRYWIHVEHLLVDHKKMSKSLGNFYTLRDLLDRGYTGIQVRYMLLQSHFRTQLNFTFEGLDAAVATLERLDDFIARLQSIRAEKMRRVLDVILENALPHPLGQQIQERILMDLNALQRKDILNPLVLSPILQRCLPHSAEKQQIVERILTQAADEKMHAILSSVLNRVLREHEESKENKMAHQVEDEKDRAVLDTDIMTPIWQKTAPTADSFSAKSDLEDLKVKKKHGMVLPILEQTMQSFIQHLADDINISAALACLFDLVREVNMLCDRDKIGIAEAEDVLDFLSKIDEVLGVLSFEKKENIPQELIDMLSKRENARVQKDWKTADECRLFIQSQGYLIKDTPTGPQLKKIKL